jgi:hypothetical protein
MRSEAEPRFGPISLRIAVSEPESPRPSLRRTADTLMMILVTNGAISDGGVRSTPIGSCVRLAPEGFVASFVLGLYLMSGASEARKGIGEGLLHVSRFRLCGGVGWSGEGSSSLGVLSRPACSYMWLHGVLS